MNETKVHGYRHKTTEELVKAIDECTSLSQLFALIQHERITIQMLTRPGASNLAPKILSPKEITGNRDTPLKDCENRFVNLCLRTKEGLNRAS
ncbi:hypothetical protein DW960_08975 [Ruminococcus bromii]|nr:hypothetical protein DW960_08975 [Ruminococcus bromii]